MTRTRVANVRNGLLAADAPGTRQRRAHCRRSTSLTASDRSDLSRVTLVENDPGLVADGSSKSDEGYEIISYDPPKYTFVDHLRGVFCLSPSKKKAVMRKEYSCARTPVGSVNDQSLSTWPSPWILPVYVYPSRGSKGSETAPKVGKCTIDTGNLQGNIVSREFVERVLEYPPERFRELTKEEERGGTGITGDLHVPEGAIYLTWYHKNSTRVFRDMRFLISPHSDCDLIIGAWSIQKNGILNVPCLMMNRTVKGGANPNPNPYLSFNPDMQAQKSHLETKGNEILELSFPEEDTRGELRDLVKDYAFLAVDNKFYSQANDLYNALQAKMPNAEQLWKELWALKDRKGLDLDSQVVEDEVQLILNGLRKKAPGSPEEFEETWETLASMHPLSSELKAKLDNNNGALNPFWIQLQSEYEWYATIH